MLNLHLYVRVNVLLIHNTTSLEDVLVFVCMCKCVSYSAHKLQVSIYTIPKVS